MRRMDTLDKVVFSVTAVILLIIVPLLAGRAVTPWLDGQPLALNRRVLAEQSYIRQAREMLDLMAQAHLALENLDSVEAITGGEAFAGAGRMQAWTEKLDRAFTEMDGLAPPGRFAAVHEQLLDLLNLYSLLASEAWAYYGDLDEAHLVVVQRGLDEGQAGREQLERLLAALDFQQGAGVVDSDSGNSGTGKQDRGSEIPSLDELPPLKLE